jgi:hypothetical protein
MLDLVAAAVVFVVMRMAGVAAEWKLAPPLQRSPWATAGVFVICF